jgi:hypothetical protein
MKEIVRLSGGVGAGLRTSNTCSKHLGGTRPYLTSPPKSVYYIDIDDVVEPVREGQT